MIATVVARVIAADCEFQASAKPARAAAAMSDTPGAPQLRLLQTVVDVAAEKNSTLVMPFQRPSRDDHHRVPGMT